MTRQYFTKNAAGEFVPIAPVPVPLQATRDRLINLRILREKAEAERAQILKDCKHEVFFIDGNIRTCSVCLLALARVQFVAGVLRDLPPNEFEEL
jgi:hypothetical protein